MLGLILLGLAIICALISRTMLVIVAARISVGWAIGVFLPFGPLFFRLNYPDQARDLRVVRYATLLFALGFLWLNQNPQAFAYYKRRVPRAQPPKQIEPAGYAWEKVSASKLAMPPAPTPTLNERLAANAKEFERLRQWEESLRVRKRDLLHSNVGGNREYVVDLALYNQALANATEQRNALSAEALK